MLISLLGYAPSFLGHFSHDTILVAPSFGFLNVVKSSYLVLFSWRKMQKTKKKTRRFSKSFTSYLHNRSTSKHNSTRFEKLQCRATIFAFSPFVVIGHVTTLPMTYWMHPDRQNHPCLVFLHFFITIDEISFFGYIQ